MGKGKPPPEHKFKKGQSGNPTGKKRHKRRQPLREQLIEAGNQVVRVPTPKGVRKMTKNRLGIELLYDDFLQGTRAERLRAFKELRRLGAFDTLPEDHKPSPEARKKFFERLAEEARRAEEWQPGQANSGPGSKP
ncbi:MAG: DUF5681 domain-containing protein [Sphingosinicella sp.]|uniref:DUF5681 domain-containing protein n=1 Tax=Sphingosinicella sp. TaxID=1917971 RepID=UPI00403844E8